MGTLTTVLNADFHSSHSDLLQKYFIAQALYCDQCILAAGDDIRNFIESCMWTDEKSDIRPPDEEEMVNPEDTKVKIAWRYESMQKFKTTVPNETNKQWVI